jgi:hypothetical protein
LQAPTLASRPASKAAKELSGIDEGKRDLLLVVTNEIRRNEPLAIDTTLIAYLKTLLDSWLARLSGYFLRI